MCAACGQPGHRFGFNEGPDRFDPTACINGLLYDLDAARRAHRVAVRALSQALGERDRLADGIREIANDLANIAAEAHEDPDGEDDPAVWARHFIASTRHRDLLALLDVAGDDHLCECGHTLQAVGPGGPYRCVMGCKYQAARDRQVKAGDDPPVPYRALEGSEGGEDGP